MISSLVKIHFSKKLSLDPFSVYDQKIFGSSSVVFGNLWQSSENVRKSSGDLWKRSSGLRSSIENFRKSSESGHKSSENRQKRRSVL